MKMCNFWPYKNHHYRSKYPIVLFQERCEKVQFKSGHLVIKAEQFRMIQNISDQNSPALRHIQGHP